jgi:hypothetical protein
MVNIRSREGTGREAGDTGRGGISVTLSLRAWWKAEEDYGNGLEHWCCHKFNVLFPLSPRRLTHVLAMFPCTMTTQNRVLEEAMQTKAPPSVRDGTPLAVRRRLPARELGPRVHGGVTSPDRLCLSSPMLVRGSLSASGLPLQPVRDRGGRTMIVAFGDEAESVSGSRSPKAIRC